MLKYDGAMPVPDWVRNMAEIMVDWLNIGHYETTVRMATFDDPGMKGRSEINYRMIMAKIEIGSELSNDDDGRTTVAHEFLHIAHTPLYAAVDRLVELLPKDQRTHGRELLSDADEPTVELMARGLARAASKYLDNKKESE
jgi:hypothetical protein